MRERFEDEGMSQDRTDNGRYTESVTLDSVLGVFEAVEGPVVTSGDVADQLACSTETARRKLRTLERRGRLDSRTTAGRVVWLRADGEQSGEINADDPFWELAPGASGERDVSERVDEVLYGNS